MLALMMVMILMATIRIITAMGQVVRPPVRLPFDCAALALCLWHGQWRVKPLHQG